MQKHTKLYLESMGYDISDYIPCEVCEAQAVDIHHIEARGMGGTKKPDTIDNLMALCRECHINFGDLEVFKDHLKHINQLRIRERGI